MISGSTSSAEGVEAGHRLAGDEPQMEPLVLSFGVAASFLLALGLTRAILQIFLLLARIDERSQWVMPNRTPYAIPQGDGVADDRLAA